MERFQFIASLGEGAYGQVWKCLDKESDTIVAIKRFKEAHHDPDVMRLLLREIRLLKASSHPNVVHLMEAFKSKSRRVYMVMEHVDNTLTEQLRRSPFGFTPKRVKLITWQLLQATAFLHSNRIIHRDLKPANILLSEDGKVKLCDFGFARTICNSDINTYTQYVVTRWYRPPELLVGGAYGTPADVWAVGCLFAEMATGRPVFPGCDTLDQLWLTMQTVGPLPLWQMQMLRLDPLLASVVIPAAEEIRPLNKRFSLFDPQMMEVIQACLQPEPVKRLTAMQVLALPYFDDIHDLLSGNELQQDYDRAYAAVAQAGSASSSCLLTASSRFLARRGAGKARRPTCAAVVTAAVACSVPAAMKCEGADWARDALSPPECLLQSPGEASRGLLFASRSSSPSPPHDGCASLLACNSMAASSTQDVTRQRASDCLITPHMTSSAGVGCQQLGMNPAFMMAEEPGLGPAPTAYERARAMEGWLLKLDTPGLRAVSEGGVRKQEGKWCS